jgi:hypothetical protein
VSYLDADGLDRIKQASYQFLKEPWALEEDGLRTAPVAWVGPKERWVGRDDLSLSATSGVGHYLRRSSTWPSSLAAGQKLPAAELEPLARDLCEALVIGGQLEATDQRRLCPGARRAQRAESLAASAAGGRAPTSFRPAASAGWPATGRPRRPTPSA